MRLFIGENIAALGMTLLAFGFAIAFGYDRANVIMHRICAAFPT